MTGSNDFFFFFVLFVARGVRNMRSVRDIGVPDRVPEIHNITESDHVITVSVSNGNHGIEFLLRNIVAESISEGSRGNMT
jgi:hypothetical protein